MAVRTVSAGFQVKAETETKTYEVRCNTGLTIHCAADGTPTADSVVLTFFEYSSYTGMPTQVAAAGGYCEILDGNGDSNADFSLAGKTSLSIRADLVKYKGSNESVHVVLYDSNGKTVANQYFPIVKDGGQGDKGDKGDEGEKGVAYDVTLSTGATVPMSAHAALKAPSGLFLNITKDGANIEGTATVTFIDQIDCAPIRTLVNSKIPANGWESTRKTLNSLYRYLWNYKKIVFSNGTSKESTPAMIGDMFYDDGNNAVNIVSVTHYYLATASSSGVTTSTGGWQTTVPALSAEKPRLWGYTKVVYNDEDEENGVKATEKITGPALLVTASSTVTLTEMYLRSTAATGVTTASGGFDLYQNLTLCLTSNKVAPRLIQVDVSSPQEYSRTFAVTYDSPVPSLRSESEWARSLTFRNGDIFVEGEPVYDTKGGLANVYMWNYPVSGNSAVKPSEDVKDNWDKTRWSSFSTFSMLATKVFFAEYAYVKNLGAGGIELYDSEGNVTFRAWVNPDTGESEVVCNQGTFDNVNVTGTVNADFGHIGNFVITDNWLRYDSPNAAIALMHNGLSISYTVNEGMTNKYMNIGPSLYHGYASSCTVVDNGNDAGGSTKYGVYSEIAGAAHNFAFFGKGDVVTDGKVCGYNMLGAGSESIAGAVAYMPTFDINNASVFVIDKKPTSGNGRIALPTYQQLLDALGVSSSSTYICMEITVTSTTEGATTVYGRNDYILGMDTDQYPYMRNGNKAQVESIDIYTGDVVKFLLFGYNTSSSDITYVAHVSSVRDN